MKELAIKMIERQQNYSRFTLELTLDDGCEFLMLVLVLAPELALVDGLEFLVLVEVLAMELEANVEVEGDDDMVAVLL